MWLTERYTFSRGRSAVPAIFLRMREWILLRVWFFDVFPIISALPNSRGSEPGRRGVAAEPVQNLVILSGGSFAAGVEGPIPPTYLLPTRQIPRFASG